MAGKRGTTIRRQQGKESTYLRKDIEDRPPQDRKYRFRDQGNLDPDDQRRLEFKKELLKSVEQSERLEGFRKSDDEVRRNFCRLPRLCKPRVDDCPAQEYQEPRAAQVLWNSERPFRWL